MYKIVLVGGGGHCVSCIEAIEEIGKYSIEGILDVPGNLNKEILGYRVIGTDDDIEKYHRMGCLFCLTFGQISSGETMRKKLYRRLKTLDVKLPVIISPHAVVSRHSELGEGTIVLAGARVNAGVKIGVNCIVNSNSLVEHGAQVGNHTHISTGSILNGDCTVSDNCLVGSGAILRNGITIVDDCTIGMGAVVTKSATKSGVYVGSPARRIK